MPETRVRRRAENEARFRAANERIEETAEAIGIEGERPYLCECADPRCTAIVRLTAGAYGAVRAAGQRFFLVPGHEHDDVDMVVERHDAYLVVEKPPAETFLG